MDREEFYGASENRILAIYPQQRYHTNAYIVGGKAGLTALRDAIDAALAGENRQMSISIGIAMAHPSDQETFSTVVVHDDELDQVEENDRCYADDMPLPYYDPKCAEQLRDGIVSLRPDEKHVMAAGVAHYLLEQKRLALSVVTPEEQSEAHPS